MDPLLFEINTRCWLGLLSRRNHSRVDLGNIPEEELQLFQQRGFTHVWLMGVWKSSQTSRRIALQHPGVREAVQEALPDCTDSDVGPSPYAIEEYQVPEEYGGNIGLALFRSRLNKLGLGLILDFVPNHAGADHPWAWSNPERFVHSRFEKPDTVRTETPGGTLWLAQGRDPYLPPWTDTLQLDYRNPETRRAMSAILQEITKQCDGVRCDMAMLPLSDVFEKTWKDFPSEKSSKDEFWPEAIGRVRAEHPRFLFIGEVYWGLEGRLQELGFDFTYDKEVYDYLVQNQPGKLLRHLLRKSPEWARKSVHFLENHDEPRVASCLGERKHFAAALLILSLPGMRFLHQGQLEGWKHRVPVQLNRFPHELTDREVEDFYQRLLLVLKATEIGSGQCRLKALGGTEEQPDWPLEIRWSGLARSWQVLVNYGPKEHPLPQAPPHCRILFQTSDDLPPGHLPPYSGLIRESPLPSRPN